MALSPDKQAALNAFEQSPTGQAALKNSTKYPLFKKLDVYTAALRAGVLAPEDIPQLGDGYQIERDGTVGEHQGMATAAKIGAGLILGGATLGFADPALFGGAAASAGTGAAAGGQVLEDGTVVGGVGAGSGAAGATGVSVATKAPLALGLGSKAATGLGAAQAGVGLFGSLFAAHEQSAAASHAADLQSEATREALDYTKQKDAQDRADAIAAQNATYAQYVAKENRLAPYRGIGQAASDSLAAHLGVTPTPQPASPPPPTFPLVGSTPSSTGTGTLQDALSPAPSPTSTPTPGALVTLRSPTGQTKQVPATQAAHYLALGATQVN